MTPFRHLPLLLPLLFTLVTCHSSLVTSAAAAPAVAVEITALESGPPVVSLLHELEHALDLATRWLAALPPDLRDSPPTLPPPLDIPSDALLTLLYSPIPPPAPDGTPLTFPQAADALAAALDRSAPQWIYLPDGTPVEWRKELLHTLLVTQRIDPATSGGYWPDPSDPSPSATLRATLHALRAISSVTHLPVPAP